MKRLKILEDLLKNFPSINNQIVPPSIYKWNKNYKDGWIHLCFSTDDHDKGKIITKYVNGRQVGQEIILSGDKLSIKEKVELSNSIEKVGNKNKTRSL